MGKNNKKEFNRQQGDRADRFAMRKVKKGVASVLVGASVLGVGVSVLPGSVFNNGDVTLEAAETGAQIMAFDHYVLEGQPYNFSDNVNAFEIIDGEMVDLTGEVDIIATNILDDRTQEITYSVVGSDGVEKTTTATITYGKDYASALASVEDALATVQAELNVLGDESDALQSQYDDLNGQLDELRAEYDAYVAYAAEQDADIGELNERAAGIEANISSIMQAITYSLADIAELSQQVEDNHAFITSEITRLEDELTALRENVDERVAVIEAELPEKATQEQVDAVQARVDAFLETSDAIEATLSGQLDTLNNLYQDIVSGSLERDEAMLEMLNLQEDRIDSLRQTLEDVSTSSEDRIAELEAELANKAEPEEVDALEAELAAIQASAAENEQVLTDQIETAEAANTVLSNRINGYESVISELEAQLDALDAEMSVLERILEAVELGADEVTVDDGDGNVEEIEDPEEFVEDEEAADDVIPDAEDPVDESTDEETPVEEPTDEETPVDEPTDQETPVDEPAEDFLDEDAPTTDDPVVEAAPVDEVVNEPVEDVENEPVDPVEPIAGEDTIGGENVEPVDETEPFLDEAPTSDGDEMVAGEDTTIDGGGVDSSDPNTPVSSDDAGATGGEAPTTEPATEPIAGQEGGAEPTAEAAAQGDLPQTGAGFGAIAGIGLTSLTAVGAGVVKFFRKRG